MIKQILKVVNVLKIALLHTNIIPAIKYVGRIVVILMISMLISMILVEIQNIQLMNVLIIANIHYFILMVIKFAQKQMLAQKTIQII